MDPFSMVVAIVLISVGGRTLSNWIKLRQQQLAMRQQGSIAGADSQQRELAALRERVATLERIVTDPGYDLKRQIQALDSDHRRAA